MMRVGLTGGIGSGKSTVARMFEALGIPIYDSDMQAKVLMSNSEKLKKAITQLLGKNAYQNGALNREFIAKKVFADSNLLEKLNKIVHPAVKEHFLDWAQEQESEYIIQESALIFENGNEDLRCDYFDYCSFGKTPKTRNRKGWERYRRCDETH